MTLAGMKQQAYNRGFQDAINGRMYRTSFNRGDRLYSMGLHAEYESGWQTGRKEVA
jgi:hypothetical protein